MKAYLASQYFRVAHSVQGVSFWDNIIDGKLWMGNLAIQGMGHGIEVGLGFRLIYFIRDRENTQNERYLAIDGDRVKEGE
eukprot:1354280-Amorphochlora_amoeboformis.AAC.1